MSRIMLLKSSGVIDGAGLRVVLPVTSVFIRLFI